VDNLTGLNCDEKAQEAGYEEGTDEYTKSVESCQAKAGSSLKMLGIVLIAVVGIVVVLPLLKKKEE